MNPDRQRYIDVLEAITKVRKYTARGREAFFQDELLQVWVLHHVQIMGEALSAISSQQRAANEAWARPVIATRNILVHHYFRINLETVWGIVENHLDALEAKVAAALASLPDES
jgi:uncharacterized protein with HEPN domain